jgi:large subunit ribosomal protein L20
MSRVTRGLVSRRKHNKIATLTKGYRGTKGRLIKTGHEAILHANAYAFHGRKLRKRDFRSLWIVRIGAAAKQEGVSYSVLMDKLKKANITLDRKILSDLVVNDIATFKHIVDSVKNV